MNAKQVGTIVTVFLATTLVVGCGEDNGSPAAPPAPTLDQQLRGMITREGITQLDPGPQPAAAQVALGQALMFDKELSGNRDISCATCHHPLMHTGDGLSVSFGTGGRGLGPARVRGEGRNLIPRNAPEVFNRGVPQWRTMFWDIRASGSAETGFVSPAGAKLPPGLENILAVQAMFPVTSNDEMRGKPGDVDVAGAPNEIAIFDPSDFTGIWHALLQRLLAIPAYVTLFNAAFPGVSTEDLGFQHAANAIAAFEIDAWTFVRSPWDRYVAGDDSALSDDAKQGAILFYGAAGCANCHSGNLLTDQEVHDIGVPQIGAGKGAEAPQDFGYGRVTGEAADRYCFRTPPLRNVTLTGPWMHDGAFVTLRAAVRHVLDPATSLRHYDPSQLTPEMQDTFQGDDATINATLQNLDPDVATPVNLTDADIDHLLSFLEGLTDPAAADLSDNIPLSVPSGLPVYD
jgi:cytochrome c peroxidase